MNSILMSIKPKWVEKIASGEKTVDVLKTVPKFDEPFKVYMYCTKGRDCLRAVHRYIPEKKGTIGTTVKILNGDRWNNELLNGKVVGEFVCDEIIVDEKGENQDIICENACLTRQELFAYEPRKTLYGLHISDLKIYDKPKALSEFGLLSAIIAKHLAESATISLIA